MDALRQAARRGAGYSNLPAWATLVERTAHLAEGRRAPADRRTTEARREARAFRGRGHNFDDNMTNGARALGTGPLLAVREAFARYFRDA
jgi:hypothetical protein